ncbi:MAG: response regulator transcription factor [Candidatus Dormibacteria bacterium]
MTTATTPVWVLIADDQTLFRMGLARLLDEDPRITVVAQASDGIEAVRRCRETEPDVILMDIQMPNLDGIKATEQIVASNPEIPVLILTTFEANTHVLAALRAGAAGYVLKDAEPEAIIASVLAVRAGERVMVSQFSVANPSVTASLSGPSGPDHYVQDEIAMTGGAVAPGCSGAPVVDGSEAVVGMADGGVCGTAGSACQLDAVPPEVFVQWSGSR